MYFYIQHLSDLSSLAHSGSIPARLGRVKKMGCVCSPAVYNVYEGNNMNKEKYLNAIEKMVPHDSPKDLRETW